MESDRSTPQFLTPEQKIAIFQWLLLGAAISVMVFLRRRMGYRVLKPLHLLGAAIMMGGMAFFGLLGSMFGQPSVALMATNPLLNLCGMGVFVFGMFQRHQRWKEIKRGEDWHTYYKGTSWLEYLPFWPAFLRHEDRISRFLDPLLCFVLGMFFFSCGMPGFGLWLLVAGFCLFGYEALAYEAAHEREMNMYDSDIESRATAEIMQEMQQRRTLAANPGAAIEGASINRNGFLVYEPQIRERILHQHEEYLETQARQRLERAALRESERQRRAAMNNPAPDAPAASGTENAA